MATTFVFARGSWLSSLEFPDFDPEGSCSEEQIEQMRAAYVDYINREISKIDDTLRWYPELSEVWGEVGNTTADPLDFEEWFRGGVCEDAMVRAWEVLD